MKTIGFTLVELLIVVAILATSAAAMHGFIQQTREMHGRGMARTEARGAMMQALEDWRADVARAVSIQEQSGSAMRLLLPEEGWVSYRRTDDDGFVREGSEARTYDFQCEAVQLERLDAAWRLSLNAFADDGVRRQRWAIAGWASPVIRMGGE